jgi:hypothetical protein
MRDTKSRSRPMWMSRALPLGMSAILLAACGGATTGLSLPSPNLPAPVTNAPANQYVAGQIVVKVKGSDGIRELNGSRVIRRTTVRAASGSFTIVLVEVPEGKEAEYIERYAKEAGAEYGELNLKILRAPEERVFVASQGAGPTKTPSGAISPTDPKLSEFHSAFQVVRLDGTTTPAGEATWQWDIHRIGAPTAWGSVDGSGVRVAITDEGVDCGHPQLAGKCVEGFDAVDNVPIPVGANSDSGGHGTHVTGTVAARADGVDMVGVAPGATIIPIRVLGPGGGTNEMVMAGMVRAAELGCRVFNASWGSSFPGRLLLEAIDFAINRGCTPVFAAGNAFAPTNQPGYPAAWATQRDGLIAVAATGATDRPATFSNAGAYVTIAAPGQPIYSLFPRTQGVNGFIQGTSMAAPHVTGVVALMLERNPALTPAQVKKILQSTARVPCTGYPKPDYNGGRCVVGQAVYAPGAGTYGWGIVNAPAAVAAAVTPP